MKGAIIDLDGTLIDSMPYWDRLGTDYIISKGLVPKADLKEKLAPLEIKAGAIVIKEDYGLAEDVSTICQELLAGIESVYREKAPLLPGVMEALQQMHAEGVKMA